MTTLVFFCPEEGLLSMSVVNGNWFRLVYQGKNHLNFRFTKSIGWAELCLSAANIIECLLYVGLPLGSDVE